MFKVGDIVKLKKDRANDDLAEICGGPVRITFIELDGAGDGFLSTKEHGGGWLFDRWLLVRDAKVDTADAANYYHAIVGYSNAESVS